MADEVLPPVYRFLFTVYEPVSNVIGGAVIALAHEWFLSRSSPHGPVDLSLLTRDAATKSALSVTSSHLSATAVAFGVMESWTFGRTYALVKDDPWKAERMIESWQAALVLVDVLYLAGSFAPILAHRHQAIDPGITWILMVVGVVQFLAPRLLWLAGVGRKTCKTSITGVNIQKTD